MTQAEDGEGFAAAGEKPPLVRFDWNEARVALLRQRWAEGASAASIARELGPAVSRCAVLGKIHRLRLTQPEFKRQHPRKEKAALKRKRRRRQVRAPRTSPRAPSALTAAFQALGLAAVFGEPEGRTVHGHANTAFGRACGLLDLSAATCRWPVGEPDAADFVFCGAAPFRRYPYCLAHCLIAYRPETSENAESPQRASVDPNLSRAHSRQRAA